MQYNSRKWPMQNNIDRSAHVYHCQCYLVFSSQKHLMYFSVYLTENGQRKNNNRSTHVCHRQGYLVFKLKAPITFTLSVLFDVLDRKWSRLNNNRSGHVCHCQGYPLSSNVHCLSIIAGCLRHIQSEPFLFIVFFFSSVIFAM